MKSLLKIIVILMLPFTLSAQSFKTKLDSLHFVLKSSTDDTMRMYACDQISNYYVEANWDSSLYYEEIELSIARKLKFDLTQADLLRCIAYDLMKLGNYPRSLEAFLQAVKIANNPESEKNILDLPRNQTRRVYRLKILEHLYHEFGHLYSNTGNPYKAIAMYLESKRIAESINDSSHLAFVYMNLGAPYIWLNKLDSALLMEKIALTLFTKLKSLQGNLYQGGLFNRIALIYHKMGENDMSRDYLYKAIQINKEKNVSPLADSYLLMSKLYGIYKQLDSSIIYAKRCLQLHSCVRDPLMIADAYTYMSSAYEEKNNTDSAHYYLKLASNLKDSLYKIKIQKQNEFLNVGFNEQMRIEGLEKENIKMQGRIRTYGLLGGISIFITGLTPKN